MPSNHLILCHALLLLPSIFPSIFPVFSSESALHIRWPKYWSFSISPSNEHSGLISFRIDWFDLLAVQATHEKGNLDPENIHTGRMPYEGRGRDLGDAKEQAKECQILPANHQKLQKIHRTDASLTSLRKNLPCQHLDLKLLAPRTVRQYVSIHINHLSHPICDTLLQQH